MGESCKAQKMCLPHKVAQQGNSDSEWADLQWHQQGVSQWGTTGESEIRTVYTLQSSTMGKTEEVSVKPRGYANVIWCEHCSSRKWVSEVWNYLALPFFFPF